MKSVIKELIITALIAIIIFLLLQTVVQSFRVDGPSMEPTLLNRQYLIVNKIIYRFREPRTGDIIVFRFSTSPERDYIKRVIGTPGDTVEIKNGTVYLNDKPLVEPYIKERPNYTYPKVIVTKGQYFVLGDNRNLSSDSHVWGMVKREVMIGKLWFRYWDPRWIGLGK